MGKIVSINWLEEFLPIKRNEGKLIGLCHGVFDLLHPGHTAYLEEAKDISDILIVTLTPDEFVNKGPGRPIFGQDLRAKELASREMVDYVAINEWPTAVETIRRLRPHYYIKGPDYKNQQLDLTGMIGEEQSTVEAVGGKLVITDTPLFSSSSLINQFLSPLPQETQAWLDKFKKVHTGSEILDYLKDLHDLKVLVIGDTIIDEYVYCDVLGASPKDNMLTGNYVGEERFAGGVLAVANHIAGFCDKVTLVSLRGTNLEIFKTLKPNIEFQDWVDLKMETPRKRRFVEPDSLKKLFEISYLPTERLSEKNEGSIIEWVSEEAKKYDLVLVTDFGHGLMTEDVISRVCNEARFLAVNTQTNSANRGFNPITKYHNLSYIALDELEVRIAARDMWGKLEDIAFSLVSRNPPLTAITRGRHGCLIGCFGYTSKVPALATSIVDAVGAGDAFLSLSSLLAVKGIPEDVIGFVGNAAGAMKTQWVGNKRSVEPVELYKFITALLR